MRNIMPLLHYYSSECAVMNYLCLNGPIPITEDKNYFYKYVDL